jgi:hypothetical protein
MTTEQTAVETIHFFGIICLVASLLIRVLPTPEEIPARSYSVFYAVLRRCSLNTGMPAKETVQEHNGDGTSSK